MSRKEILIQELNRIIAIIKSKYNPIKIILFGSLANGNIHDWSDIDLAIVKESENKFTDRIYELLQLIKPEYSINLLVYTPAEVQNMENNNNYFWINEISKKGQVLYAK